MLVVLHLAKSVYRETYGHVNVKAYSNLVCIIKYINNNWSASILIS